MKIFFGILAVVAILWLAVYIGLESEWQANPVKACCVECRAAFSRSQVDVGPAGVSCGSFPTAEPISEECAAVFAQRPMTVADCQGV